MIVFNKNETKTLVRSRTAKLSVVSHETEDDLGDVVLCIHKNDGSSGKMFIGMTTQEAIQLANTLEKTARKQDGQLL